MSASAKSRPPNPKRKTRRTPHPPSRPSRSSRMTDAPPASSASAAPPARPRKRILRRLWRFTVTIFALIGLFSVLRPFLFDITPLASGSMSPTLQGDENGGDWVLAEKVTYWFRDPRRWEVVEFH